MNYQTDAEILTRVSEPMITLSEDGYVRLTLETFLTTPLVHLLSDLDDDNLTPCREGASLVRISGYTEWISTTTPTITIGWEWQLGIPKGNAIYARLNAPRSNVMLVDAMQHDLGSAKTLVLLEAAIDMFAWQEEVQTYIATQYI